MPYVYLIFKIKMYSLVLLINTNYCLRLISLLPLMVRVNFMHISLQIIYSSNSVLCIVVYQITNSARENHLLENITLMTCDTIVYTATMLFIVVCIVE